MTISTANPYHLLVFDWDGTLMDSGAYIIECMKKAAIAFNLPVPDDHSIRNIIGLSMTNGLQLLFPDLNEEQLLQFLQRYRDYYFSTEDRPVSLFPEVTRILEELQQAGYILAVATGKSRRGLNEDLQLTQLIALFSATRCAEETASKPNPLMLFELLEELVIPADRALVIGDTEYDVQMAVNAGVDALGVSYGMHDAQRLLISGAKKCIDDIILLPDWLKTVYR